MGFFEAVHAKAIELGRGTVKATAATGSGHPSSGLSLAHITTVLMYKQMRVGPEEPLVS